MDQIAFQTISCKHDAAQDVTGIAHANLILDTRVYWPEFTGGKIMELTTNIIVKIM